MEAIRKEKVASVALLLVKLSEDELQVYQAALSYVLDTLDDKEIESLLGAGRDELEGMRDDLREAMVEHVESAVGPQPVARTS